MGEAMKHFSSGPGGILVIALLTTTFLLLGSYMEANYGWDAFLVSIAIAIILMGFTGGVIGSFKNRNKE